jgi:hypothetical protein
MSTVTLVLMNPSRKHYAGDLIDSADDQLPSVTFYRRVQKLRNEFIIKVTKRLYHLPNVIQTCP